MNKAEFAACGGGQMLNAGGAELKQQQLRTTKAPRAPGKSKNDTPGDEDTRSFV